MKAIARYETSELVVRELTSVRLPTTAWGWDLTGPVWGARAYRSRAGQDHLGLASVSTDRLLPALSPGINVLTVHPRYWSVYVWILTMFWAQDRPRTRTEFQKFYRPREAVFSAACHVCEEPEHATVRGNVVGSRRISPIAAEPWFPTDFDYIKQPLGGYELYYRSTMEQMGLLVIAKPANGFPIDAPLPAGRAVADAYHRSVTTTRVAQYFADAELPERVSHDELLEFSRHACLCQLRSTTAEDRLLLQDLFLHAGDPTEASARSRSLRFVLDLADKTEQKPVQQDDFRQYIYFRSHAGIEFQPRLEMMTVARGWRVYQGREYFSYVFNRLLQWVVRRGLDLTDGGFTLLPMEDLWRTVDESLNRAPAEFGPGHPLGSITASSPVDDIVEALRAQFTVSGEPDVAWQRHELLDEHALFQGCQKYNADDGKTLVMLVAMFVLLRQRFGMARSRRDFADEQASLAAGGRLRVGMQHVFDLFNQRNMKRPTISSMLRWLIEDYVIIQHERVAAQKLPDDTYRVRRIGTGLKFFEEQVGAGFNDSRFDAISTVAHELGWTGHLGVDHHELTEAGRRLMDSADAANGRVAAAVNALGLDEENDK